MRGRTVARLLWAAAPAAALLLGAPEAAFAAGKRPAQQAPTKKPAAKKGATHKAPRAKGSTAKSPDPAARIAVAGRAAESGASSDPELAALRAVDRELFPELYKKKTAEPPWELPPELGGPGPRVEATGVPRSAATPSRRAFGETPADLGWLAKLAPPDIPFRWDPRVIRYLEHYKHTPKGKAMAAHFLKKSGRYGDAIRKALRDRGMPEDIAWLAMMESGYNPQIVSPAGAAGLWQFMPKAADAYGLRIDRWVDERLDPERSTIAAIAYLQDLERRFGRWELAFAAYNMGYGGLLSSIRKYNSNDYWELSRLEAGIPLETALYVPKIISIAIVARNPAAFGLEGIELDPPESFDAVAVGPGIALGAIASAAGTDVETLRGINPHLLEPSTPPPSDKKAPAVVVRLPEGAAAKLGEPGALHGRTAPADHERHVVRWGESLSAIAADRGTTEQKIRAHNGISSTVPLRPGTVLWVPSRRVAQSETPVVPVPALDLSEPGRRRIVYEVVWGDRLEDIARVLGVTVADLTRWNRLDPSASLHGRMLLQAFVSEKHDLSAVRYVPAEEARLLAVGSEEFFQHFESKNGRERIVITTRPGETFHSLSKKYEISVGMLERINHRSRSSELLAGETLVVYAKRGTVPRPAAPPAPVDPGESEALAAETRED